MNYIYIYIYAFSRRFYPKRLTVHSCYKYYFQYMCSLGIEPTTFALLTQCSNHRATGTLCTTIAKQWASGSRRGISVHSKCHQKNAPVFVVHDIEQWGYCAHTITPPPPWATRSKTLTSANRSPTQRHKRCLHLPCTVKTGIHP